MAPIVYKDIDALCARRRKYVSDDFPWIGYDAAFGRCVDGALRDRKNELRDMSRGDYYKSRYEDGAFAQSVAAVFNDTFSLGGAFFEPGDEIAALLQGRINHFEIIDCWAQFREKFGVDVSDLLMDRMLTFGQMVDFLARK